MVRKSYANITSPQQKYAMVRGARVSFSAATLKKRWGLEEVVNGYAALLEGVSESELNDILCESSLWKVLNCRAKRTIGSLLGQI